MKFTVITLFPELIEGYCRDGLLGTALKKGLVDLATVNPRQFTSDVHHTVDDRAFGGGDGMVMKPEPLAAAVDSVLSQGPAKIVVLSPQGRRWTQEQAREWASRGEDVVLVSGRYAGIDQRFIEEYADEEISLGDYILNGGELAALAILESVARLVPGALGNAASAVQDSFTGARLEPPQFTRPREWQGRTVPSFLMSGDHARIAKLQHALSVVRTALLRPDLLADKAALPAAVDAVLALSDDDLKSLGLEREQVRTVSV